MEVKEKKVKIKDKTFEIKTLIFQNSYFIFIYEDGKDRIGALALSIMGNTLSLFPAKFGENFAKILAQLISEELGNITLVSIYLSSELDNESYRLMIKEVKGTLLP